MQGHRGRTFVILLPGEITASPELLHPLIEDISLLHGAGPAHSMAYAGSGGMQSRSHIASGQWPTQSVHRRCTRVHWVVARGHWKSARVLSVVRASDCGSFRSQSPLEHAAGLPGLWGLLLGNAWA